jgi:hypothetical protein
MTKVLSKPTVRFSARAWQKMWALTNACPIEISAMGIIEPKENHSKLGIKESFYVTDFFVVDQECTGTSTDMDESALIDLHMDLREKGVKSEDICVWWHSHVNMETGHSGTDESQIDRFDFDKVCISAITNKRGDLNLRIDMYDPIRHTFEKCNHIVDDIPIVAASWGKEMVDGHVTKSIPTVLDVKKYQGIRKGLGKTSPSYYGAGITKGHGWSYGGDWGGYDSASGNLVHSLKDEPEVVEEVEHDIDFPHKLLQECYEDGIIEPNEAVKYYGQLCRNDISDEELNEELEALFVYAPTEELDDDGDGGISLTVGAV